VKAQHKQKQDLHMLAALTVAMVIKTFSIPAGQAEVTLNEFSTQSGLQMLFNYEQLKPYRTHAVQGVLNAFDALNVMIAGTGITYDFINQRTVTLQPPPQAESVRMGQFDAMLIGETCRFGVIPSGHADRILGDTPGHCWCCTSANFLDPHAPTRDYYCAALLTAEACSVYDGSHTNYDIAASSVEIRGEQE
jgi:hypothetical protein